MTEKKYIDIKIDELKSKISYLDDQKKINKILQNISKKRIITTNGCFDLLHNGHLHSFYEARTFGDILIVGLNSDSSIRRIKGINRPIRKELNRASILASIKYIDYVVIFNENTPEKFLNKIRPDIHCKGGDYNDPKELFEYNLLKKFGGEIKILEFIDGNSTTNEIEKISRLKKL